jgi:ribulose-5-phosphate 4-epimerase/fuculose-1-phosphate aldolase
MEMTNDESRIETLIVAARQAAAAGLVVGSSGNASVRLSANRFAVTTSGARLGGVDREHVSLCDITGENPAVGPEPSLESPMHRAVYRGREDAGAVLHFQSPFATLLACAVNPRFDLDFIPEIPAYVRRIGIVPFHLPGSTELAEAVAAEARDPSCNVIVLLGHGQIALGPDPEGALRRAEFFEFACRLSSYGVELRRYDRATIEALRKYGS